MQPALPSPTPSTVDQWLFGWDPTPGIVSCWADRSGRALIWQRIQGRVACERARFKPWLFATTLDDVKHLGSSLILASSPLASDAQVSYQELDGPSEGVYRYLLTASSFRTLERAILTGAGRRLGHPISRLADLDDYYTFGPVEQYLLQTGRVYFRGMAYSDLHRLQFDLETTSLSPADGRIFLIAVKDSLGLETVLEAANPEDEARVIADLCILIRERDPDVIENHNLFGFDLPFLDERARMLGVPLAFGRAEGPVQLERYTEPGGYRRRRRTRYSVAGRELIDTLSAVWRHDFSVRDMPGYGLKAAARYFGVAAPERTYLPGHAIYHTYQTDPDKVRRYALDDVREVDGLSQMLMGASFALAGMAPRSYERVASAGPAMGILEPLLVRAYHRAGYALPRSEENRTGELGRHQGGATYLLQGGVARHVVKADVASMYPSIMCLYQIGPECDRLGVLPRLVGRLVELRLRHKDAARTALPGSSESAQHRAMAAAMKVIVNAAYGYLGAGQMALFADRAAADAVTARGRALLDQVVAELHAHDVALLEADTDGVFFAVPERFSEADERSLVAEVAATLPDGIRLEYEGRYRAMLCHEVKNYALLTYDGDLILRGGALRSSRAEPFGVRFLGEAIGCLLRGDVAGVVRVYQETVAGLRERRLPLAEVATRARLAKPSEEYQRTRRKLREASYEAVLGAGRTSWEVGERVRFYRAEGGRAVLLPNDPNLEPEADEEAGEFTALPGGMAAATPTLGDKRDYDIAYYVRLLRTSYLSRLRKAFRDQDFRQLFRDDAQLGMFDQPLDDVKLEWIEASGS